MKKLISFLSLIILAACGEKGSSEEYENSNLLEDFSYSIDTLILNVGDEVFNPQEYSSYDLSEDGNILYLFYNPEKEMHEYDLTKRKLVARHPFETDGPNLIPSYFNYFQALPEEEFFMADFARAGIYSLDGTKMQTYKIQSENITGLGIDNSYPLTNNIHISPDKQKIVSLPKIFGEPVAGLAVIDLDNWQGKMLDLPALDITNKYLVTFQEENGLIQTGDFHKIQFLNDQFIIYSGATSDIYTYDWKRDSLRLLPFQHVLVAKTKTGDFPTKANSLEHNWEVGKQILKQITFGKFYWDETRGKYFRIGTTNEDYTKTYLFSYDENFTLTGESLIPDFHYMPYMDFFHAGKLYSYFIVGEEPALVELTFNF